jgi:ADP-ribose pyrophosphatase YjhB (NUDIX family)
MSLMDNCVYLSQKALVFGDEDRFLTLLRNEDAPTRPLTWDLPGGEFEVGENPTESIRREIREEANIEVAELHPVIVYGEYNASREYWLTIMYTARAQDMDVRLSYEHKNHRWVTEDEFLALESSDKWWRLVKQYFGGRLDT